MPEANKNNKPKPKAKLYFGNADELAKTNNYVTPEYLQEVDKRRKDWNEFIGFLKKENVAGSENLDKGGAGLGYLKKWNKANPDKAFTEEDIKDVQYYSRNTKKETGERVNDGILGKVTSTFSFPDSRVNTYEMKNGQKVLVKSEDPNIGNYQYQADKINFGIAGKNKTDVSKLPIYNKNSATTDISWDKNDPTANNLLKEQAKKRSLSGQSLSSPEKFVKPLMATEYHPAVQEQLEGSYFDNNQKVVDYNQNLQQQKQAEVQQQADTRTALQKKLATSKSKDFTKEEALDYFNETGKVLPQSKVQSKYNKDKQNRVVGMNDKPLYETESYRTLKDLGYNIKEGIKSSYRNAEWDTVSRAVLSGIVGAIPAIVAPIPTAAAVGAWLAQPAVTGLGDGIAKTLKKKTKRIKNEEFGMPTFQDDNSDLTKKREGGLISNNMKKRTLKKYQYSYGGLTVTDLNKYDDGGVANKGTNAAAGALSTVANAVPGAGLAVPILDMMGKATSDEYGAPKSGLKGTANRINALSNLGRVMEGKDVGRSLLGLTPFGAIAEGTGLSKAIFGKSDYDIEAEERDFSKKNQELYTKMNTSQNFGNSNVNTSNNMMFAAGGMLLNQDDPNANAELELQETFQMPDGTVGNVDGPSHENGGIAVDLPEGTRIWSDKLKHNGKTFAKHTKPITNTIAKLEKQIEKNPVNSDAKENSIALLKNQLDYYFDTQESNKQNTEMKRTLREGGMIKRADGSYSKRGLWDNIRANKGSGKKPTPEMLKQERKINNEMAMGGYMYGQGGTNNPGFNALPEEVQENILAHMSMGGRLMDDHMYAEGGKLPQGVLQSRLEAHMSPEEADEYLSEYGKGGYTVRRSSDRKGKTHVVIGPDGTKEYFGDPNMGEKGKSKYGKEAFYARHKKNLAGNPYFRAYAKATWEEGGTTPKFNYNNSEIDQITGRPTGKGGLEDASLDVLQTITTPLALANLYKAGKIGYDAYELAKPNVINLSKTYSPTYRKALLQAGKALSPFEDGGMMGKEYAEGGIHIKPENRGKFTAYAKSHGKGVQEMAAHIMANKEDYSPTIVKRANFAKNAASWKHEMGGMVKYRVGGPFEQDEEYLTGYGTPNVTTPYIPMEYNENSFPMGETPRSLRSVNPYNQNATSSVNANPYRTFYETDPNIPKGQPIGSTAGAGMPPATTPESNWFKDNPGLVGQLGTAALTAGTQMNRINRLARPRTLADVRLRENVANPNLVDYSAERNAIDRAALTGMAEAQRGFGSSAAAQAFKNKARLNQLEGTGRSFQGQENANAQIRNQFLAARQEAAMKEAMMNSEIGKYNLENVYGYDENKTRDLNAITGQLGNVASQTFGNISANKNQLKQLEMLARGNYKGVNRKTLIDLGIDDQTYETLTGQPAPKKYGGTIKRSFKIKKFNN